MNRNPFTIIEWEGNAFVETGADILIESPLTIRIDGNSYAVIMRTPGEEKHHAAGFCLGEGIVDHPQDITSIGLCDHEETNVVTVTIAPERRSRIPDVLKRKTYISQTSCGICGKELIDDLRQALVPFPPGPGLSAEAVMACFNSFPKYQDLRLSTKSSHAAAIYNDRYELMSISEDVGRHNALDKAIGRMFLNNELQQACFVILSSRISFELVQKAARAGINTIIGYSRPTMLALDVADRLGMTVACGNKKSGLFIFTHPNRLMG